MLFPKLKTGVLLQYGSSEGRRHATRVLRFIDGSEQRYRVNGNGRKRWVLRYSQLDEGELSALDDFLRSAQGTAQEFGFEDPDSGMLHGRCRLGTEHMRLSLTGEHGGEAEIEIVEVTD